MQLEETAFQTALETRLCSSLREKQQPDEKHIVPGIQRPLEERSVVSCVSRDKSLVQRIF